MSTKDKFVEWLRKGVEHGVINKVKARKIYNEEFKTNVDSKEFDKFMYSGE